MAGQKLSFEREVEELLQNRSVIYRSNVQSTKLPDFTIGTSSAFHVELKEKRNRYSPKNWKGEMPQQWMFILDELTVRKLTLTYSCSGIMVRDDSAVGYYFCGIICLLTMPRVRTNRMMMGSYVKGKWILDLRNFKKADSLPGAMRNLKLYRASCIKDATQSACYGEYIGEDVGISGSDRTVEQIKHDYEATR